MDYREMYEAVLKRAKEEYDMHKDNHATGIIDAIERIFPDTNFIESEDEKIRKWLISYLENRVLNTGILEEKDSCKEAIAWLEEQKPVEEINGEDYGIDGLYAAMDILNKTLGQVEGYQSDDGILEHKAAMTAVKKLYKQKHIEWSEEIEIEIWEKAKKVFPDSGNMQSGFVSGYKEAINSLHPQPQSEWSEEDENIVEDIEEAIINYWHGDTKEICIDWLKSLRPQSHWKPSEEQLNNILDVLSFDNCTPKRRELLESLYKQLKKL